MATRDAITEDLVGYLFCERDLLWEQHCFRTDVVQAAKAKTSRNGLIVHLKRLQSFLVASKLRRFLMPLNKNLMN